MRRRIARRKNRYTKPYSNIVAIWGLRILIQLEGWRRMDQENKYLSDDDDVMRSIGLESLVDKQIGKRELLRILKKKQNQVEESEMVFDPTL